MKRILLLSVVVFLALSASVVAKELDAGGSLEDLAQYRSEDLRASQKVVLTVEDGAFVGNSLSSSRQYAVENLLQDEQLLGSRYAPSPCFSSPNIALSLLIIF